MPDNDTVNKDAQAGNTGPFWLGWNLAGDRNRWAEWLYKNIDNPVPTGKLHFTMFYCKDNGDDKQWPQPMQAAWSGKPTGVGILGKALVVLFDAPQFVHSRFTQLGKDYQHSFPALIPHMTLSYDGSGYGDDLQSLHKSILDNKLNLSFNNESIQPPDDPTDKAAFMDVMSSMFPDTSESAFETAFRSGCKLVPDIAKHYASGNVEQYKQDLCAVIEAMESVRPHRG